MNHVAKNYADILERIERCAKLAGRSADQITLIAVSKTFSSELISELKIFPSVHLGENKVQEALSKIGLLSKEKNFHWHFIGHLQSNKVKKAISNFEMIHSIHNVKLLLELEKQLANTEKKTLVLIEVNIGAESSKSGCLERDVDEILECAINLKNVSVNGFMTIPPYDPDEKSVRVYFSKLRNLLEEKNSLYRGKLFLKELSMGMSGDFEIAIEEGATFVRVGSSIFGQR